MTAFSELLVSPYFAVYLHVQKAHSGGSFKIKFSMIRSLLERQDTQIEQSASRPLGTAYAVSFDSLKHHLNDIRPFKIRDAEPTPTAHRSGMPAQVV